MRLRREEMEAKDRQHERDVKLALAKLENEAREQRESRELRRMMSTVAAIALGAALGGAVGGSSGAAVGAHVMNQVCSQQGRERDDQQRTREIGERATTSASIETTYVHR